MFREGKRLEEQGKFSPTLGNHHCVPQGSADGPWAKSG
jgi:hypothetical protein